MRRRPAGARTASVLAALLLLAPGPRCARAAAVVMRAVPSGTAARIPALSLAGDVREQAPLAGALLSGAGLSASLPVLTLPSPALSASEAPVPAARAGVQASLAGAAAVGPAARVLASPAARRSPARTAGPGSVTTRFPARSSLRGAAASITASPAPAALIATLSSLFHGARSRRSGPVAAGVDAQEPLGGFLRHHDSVYTGAAPLQAAQVPGPADDDPEEDLSPEARRGILGMFWSRAFSMVAFSIGSIAYPLLLIEAVGKAQMFQLFSLGGLISIGISLAAGKVADRMPLKRYMLINTALRGVLGLANAGLYAAGWLNFWTLLGLSVINAWQFSTLFITDPAMMTELVGKNRFKIRSAETLIRISTILVSIFSGLFLSRWVVDSLGLTNTFLIISVIFLLPLLILAKTLPDIRREAAPGKLGTALKAAKEKLRAVPWNTYGLNAALLAAAIGSFFFLWRSPLPVVAVVSFMLLRSKVYREVIAKHRLLKLALIFVMFVTVAEVPLRNAVLGALAQETVGAVGKAGFLGELLASFYAGQLPTATGLLDPKLDIDIRGRKVNLRAALKWVGAAVLAFWLNFILIPSGWMGPLLAAAGLSLPAWGVAALGWAAVSAAAAAFYHGAHTLAAKVSERGWLRLEVAGLLGLSLPLLFWGAPQALFTSLFLFGLVHAPTVQTIHANYSSQSYEHARGSFQFLMGIKGSFLNMATATAYALYGLARTMPARLWGETSAFPFTWYVVAGVCLLIAAAFLIGSFVIPFKTARGASPSAEGKRDAPKEGAEAPVSK